ncbi:GNAT family N-acetyltransferase [Vannielia litorea]|uniref:L-ornithine N(alpha)-acyltransferase n=1 Tax=Vannielia litorea TaxID=1217970 RepID=A0A1N6F4W6_9RHOB|nr:GNAT family N-acyltransferase [Vannielia litorea]SIN90338.1 ornithine-acyl[acyl carrier protein] N-acyltransferase [Vannielia litorea]
MHAEAPKFELRLADGRADLAAAQRLRYEVFVEELGGDGEMVDHAARLEADRYDPHFDHLLLIDHARAAELAPEGGGAVVGVYRLLPGERAPGIGGFYTEGEYDLAPLKASGRKLLELGRSCLAPEYRGGIAMYHLWGALWDYVEARGIEILFGTASFHGTDTAALAAPLSMLHHNHLAPPELRPLALPPHGAAMDILPEAELDRAEAMRAVPALIKAYLRLGGWVGQGAWVDHAFNTTDVCLVLDASQVSPRQVAIYRKDRAP